MSTQVLPAIPGLTYPWVRSPKFQTRRQINVSGKEVRIADWQYPRYTWTLTYDALRQGTIIGTYSEYVTLRGFFEQMLGGWDSFLYTDPDDYSVTNQGVGVGNASTLAFQLSRGQGGFAEPVYAPNLSQPFNLYLNGVLQTTGYSVSQWGSNTPGVVTFVSPPGSGVVITATFQYYWPVRFDDDTLDFEKFMSNLWNLKKMSFMSIK